MTPNALLVCMLQQRNMVAQHHKSTCDLRQMSLALTQRLPACKGSTHAEVGPSFHDFLSHHPPRPAVDSIQVQLLQHFEHRVARLCLFVRDAHYKVQDKKGS
jgi:hypothetical protein